MFINNQGKLRANAEEVFERIKGQASEEMAQLSARKAVLRTALAALESHLANTIQSQRDATLSLLYKKIADLVFEVHLSILTSAARERIQQASTREEKHRALQSFVKEADGLGFLYGLGP